MVWNALNYRQEYPNRFGLFCNRIYGSGRTKSNYMRQVSRNGDRDCSANNSLVSKTSDESYVATAWLQDPVPFRLRHA